MTGPVRPQADPVRTSKIGWVLLSPDGGSGYFRGLSVGIRYGPHDRARCLPQRCPVGDDHAAPHLRGSCGFHGSTADPLERMLPEAALLDVELFGRVIRHERGWRAAGQRVLGVQFLRGCAACMQPVADPVLVAVPALIDTRAALVAPRCTRCARIRGARAHGHAMTASELAGLVGTEVSWLGARASREVLGRQDRLRRGSAAV